MRTCVVIALLILGCALHGAPVGAGNLHLVESLPNGFALYRSGRPDAEDLEEICELGIEEMCVLAGNAERHEEKHREHCPELRVVYDERQDADDPVTEEFLEWFDAWVDEARGAGRKIAVRCNCGCHRTGRLVAYYQMKYQNLTVDDALEIMYARGKNWVWHRNIEPQVRAIGDYLAGRPCGQKRKYCVRRDAPE
jgi:protein-tyrosine phosphatase